MIAYQSRKNKKYPKFWISLLNFVISFERSTVKLPAEHYLADFAADLECLFLRFQRPNEAETEAVSACPLMNHYERDVRAKRQVLQPQPD